MPIEKIEAIEIVLPTKPERARAYVLSFKEALIPEIAQLDHLIEMYNQAETAHEKIQALNDLEAAMQKMDRQYPDDIMNVCPDYHEKIHKGLFAAIKRERKALGNMPNETTMTFQEYMVWMDPEKVDRMLGILLAPGFHRDHLIDVYTEGEEGRDVFMALLARYDIQAIAGNNSKNFKLEEKDTGTISILKAENRMGMPKAAVHHLRENSMANTFTPTRSERVASCITYPASPDKPVPVTRTILFTTLCEQGDLEKHAKTEQDLERKADTAIALFIQMGTLLEGIQRDGHVFLDMKNSNWLIDEFGELQIADTKSFLWADDDGGLQPEHPRNKFYGTLCSYQMNPPEFYDFSKGHKTISVDRLHAFMLGKNLYQYMTGCSVGRFLKNKKLDMTDRANIMNKDSYIHEASDLSFDHDIFRTPKGQAMKRIIESLICEEIGDDDLNGRISVHQAIESLALIEYPELVDCSINSPELFDLKVQSNQLLKNIALFKINEADPVITAFIETKRAAIEAADNIAALTDIHKELASVKYYLRENRGQILAIKSMIRDLIMSPVPAEVKKGRRIEEAMLAVPMMERGGLADGKTKSQQAVLNAMASELNFFRRRVQSLRHRKGEPIKPGNDAEKFLRFKKMYATNQAPNETPQRGNTLM